MNQPVNNNQPGHPAPMNRRPRLARRNAEEHVPLTRRAQRALYRYMIAADRALEFATMAGATRTFGSVVFDARVPGEASRNTLNTGTVQVTGDAQAVGSAQATTNAQTVEVIRTVEITQTVEVTRTVEIINAPQTAEAGLNALTGDNLTGGSSTTTSSASIISSVVVVDTPAFGAAGTSSSSTGDSSIAVHENSHEQDGDEEEENDHVLVDQVTGSSSNGDMSFEIVAAVADMDENDLTMPALN